MGKNEDGRAKANNQAEPEYQLDEKPAETTNAANFPKKSDQGGKFSPQGKQDQGDWDNAPGEGKPSTQGRTSEDSRIKGPPDGQERSAGTS
jgi:hypothetical protein